MSVEDPDGFSTDILDLISRQKVEIENWRDAYEKTIANNLNEEWELVKHIGQLKAEIERLKEQQNKVVKEFAEKLKAISQPYVHSCLLVSEFQISELVREMVGDES